MISALLLRARIPLPPGRPGAFDHGDVDVVTGRVFVAHTDFGTVDVIDAQSLECVGVVEGCPEGSGVVCAGSERVVFAASRGAGKVVVIYPDHLQVRGEIKVGPKPNGLAWDGRRRHLLVADVDPANQAARLIRLASMEVAASTQLPGRPRWCVFDQQADRFLVNIREPVCLVSLTPSGAIEASWPISVAGPHGLDLDREAQHAFVACDGGAVIVVDLGSGRELAAIGISGEPDAIWFNPVRHRLYVAIANPGLVDVVDTERQVLAESIRTGPGAKTTAFDVERQRLYVFLSDSCAALVLEES